MSTSASISMGLGKARQREADAKVRRQKYEMPADVRAERARLLEAQDAKKATAQQEATAEKEVGAGALRAVLERGTLDELSEISRMTSRLDSRRLQALVDDAFRTKSRPGIAAAPESSADVPPASRASSARRAR